MPGAFANPEACSAMPSGCPAVWLDAQGRATVEVGLYATLNEEGRQVVHAEMARLEREYAERKPEKLVSKPAPTTAPFTPAERLARSAEDLIVPLLDLAGRLADFRDNLESYGSVQEVPDDPDR